MTSDTEHGCSDYLRRKSERERAAQWLAGLGEGYTLAQEDKLIGLCLNPEVRVPIKWVGVTVKHGGNHGVVAVASDALRLAHPQGPIRISVSCRGAQMLCDALGLQMPTPLIIDRIWEQASLRVTPKTYTPDASARVHVHDRQGQSVVVSMMGMTAMIAHSDRIQASIEGEPELVCNVGKWWVLSKSIAGQPPGCPCDCANYGWFASGAPSLSVTGKHLWQPVSTRHNQFHRDYSQTFVPIGAMMLVNGVPMRVANVLRDPELCGLISHEGVLEFSRHPNLPFFTPDECDATDLSPDPRRVPLLGEEQEEEEMPTKPVGAVLSNYVQAVNYTPAAGRAIDLVVIHTMEAPEKPGTARGVAQWFASKDAPKASAHYCIDDATTIQCVREQDVAWAAPGSNHNGVHLEHAGYASQTPSQWDDVYSRAVLERSAVLCARICERHHIPVIYVDAEGLLRGERGVTTHAQVTKACSLAKTRNARTSPFYKAKTTHTDPGPNFPMVSYLGTVRSFLETT